MKFLSAFSTFVVFLLSFSPHDCSGRSSSSAQMAGTPSEKAAISSVNHPLH